MRRVAAVLTAGVVALGGGALAGCGDDNEGPAEEAGKALDDAGGEVGDELEKGGKKAERELDDAGDDGKD
jgi:hypothetical protein